MKDFYKDRRLVVTGAAGTVGIELINRILDIPVKEVRALDNNESNLYSLKQKHINDKRLQAFICDVRDIDKLNMLFQGMHMVFHAAALKHVEFCERSPTNAVKTNILGAQNVIQASVNTSVEKVLLTSSDKAVNPTSVMGTSKLMGERLFTAANATIMDSGSTIFASTRFGNVAGSTGSVIPTFCQQIAKGGPITLTDREMTRFIMTLETATTLVMNAMMMFYGGEVFVTKMPVIRIIDLAEVMIELLAPIYGYNPSDIEINEIGSRPGEKLWEELISDEEVRRSEETENWFIVLPAFHNIYGTLIYDYKGIGSEAAKRPYTSADEAPMSKSELKSFLREPLVLPEEIRTRLL